MTSIKKTMKDKYWPIILFSIFIFSFALNLYVLTRHSLSYGIDGAFYNYQIVSILKTGFPVSNDPPLAYYILTPFSLIGNPFLGLKIGISLIGSLLAFPAYYLTEMILKDSKTKTETITGNETIIGKIGSKIPALLSAFLITVNVNYFSMVGNFGILQNLVGVFFLVLMLYFLIKWTEDTQGNKKYGIITIILLACNLLTHIYTGALAVILFFSVMLFTIIYKRLKTQKWALFDIKIMSLLLILSAGTLATLFITYPLMYSKLTTVLSFFGLAATQAGDMHAMGQNTNYNYFCSLPYLLGIFAAFIVLKRGFKEKINASGKIDKSVLLTFAYLVLAAVLGILTFMSTEYQSRFMLLSFIPIALLVPLGLKYVQTELAWKKPAFTKTTTVLIAGIAIIFAFSSFYTASTTFSSIGPTITEAQYNELVEFKQDISLDNSTIIMSSSNIGDNYWVEYVFETDVEMVTQGPENQSDQKQQNNQNTYYISLSGNSPASKLMMESTTSGSFFLSYGPSILPDNLDVVKLNNNQNNTRSNIPSDHRFNNNTAPNNTDSSQHPPHMSNSTMSNDTRPPGNFSPNNQTVPTNNMQGDNQQRSGALNSLTSSGTLIFSGDYVKIYKIS